MGYMSYLQFFTELKQIIRDCGVEFSTDTYAGYSDNEFNIKYTTLLGRLQNRCNSYSEAWFFGPSKYISGYVDEIRATKEYPRSARFEKLLEITDQYMRGAM